MNIITNKNPAATISGNKGLWYRGPYSYDTCPPDHFTDCMNCIFPGPNQINIREPVTTSSIINGRTIVSYFIATVAGGACLLTLNSDGKFYNETVGPTLLGTITGTGGVIPDDIAAINVFSRTYLSFKYKGKALPGGMVYYFDGTNFASVGLIASPISGPTLAQVNAGIVDPGVHGVAVCYVTRTGFITKPSPVTSITSAGSKDIEVTGILTGPAQVVARLLLMTPANETELYFVPGGTISNNTATTATINIHDSALIASADYLNDIYMAIPSCSAIRFYAGRLVYIGQDVYPDNILVSGQADPETVNTVTGIVNMPVDYGVNTCNTGLIINNVLYIMKPNGTYSVQDNGGDPSTWSVSVSDSGLGAFENGLSLFAYSMSGSDTSGMSFVASPRGLMMFNGTYSPVPLTYKIEGLWNLIDPTVFYTLNVAHDIWNKRVYISVPLQPAPEFGTCNTNGTAVTSTGSSPAFFKGMEGMPIIIAGLLQRVYQYVDSTHIVLYSSVGVHTGLIWSIIYPGNPPQPSNNLGFVTPTTNSIIMGDYSDGLDPLNIKWSVWFSEAFGTGTGIAKMTIENFTLSYTVPVTPIYQLSFATGGTTIFKISVPYYYQNNTGFIFVEDHKGDSTYNSTGFTPIMQYIISSQLSGGDGISCFTALNISTKGAGYLYPMLFYKDRAALGFSTQFIRPFNLSVYQGVNFNRLINVVNEGLSVGLLADQNQPGGYNGAIHLGTIEVYANKLWSCRPSAAQSY